MAKKTTKTPKSSKERTVWGTGTYAKKSAQLRKQVGKVKAIQDYEKYILKG
jgi:hypothetical protein